MELQLEIAWVLIVAGIWGVIIGGWAVMTMRKNAKLRHHLSELEKQMAAAASGTDSGAKDKVAFNTELDAVENAVREMYPDQKVLAVFQPHLFTRTRDFIDDFAKSLAKFDEVVLLDIYPARELPIEGVDSEWLLSKIENENKSLQTKEKVVASVKNTEATVVVMLGAGDIGVLIEEVTEQIIAV